ncbi:MAG: hypothetical protein AAHH96_07070 [Candidatus Symbiodolus clandestinus]
MLQLADVKDSFQKRDLEKFKKQVNSFPKGSNLAMNGEEEYNTAWNQFIRELYEDCEGNREYIAALKQSPDDTFCLIIENLESIRIGIRIISQMSSSLINGLEGKSSPNPGVTSYICNVPCNVPVEDVARIKSSLSLCTDLMMRFTGSKGIIK